MSPPDETPLPPSVAWAVEVVTAGGGDAEMAADALWRAGAVAIEERAVTGGGLVLVAAGTAGTDALVAAVAGRWPAEAVAVDAGAALDAWRPHARPVVAGRFVVRPPWLADAGSAPGGDGDPIPVEIDPGRAFGSGSHPSTRLALAALGDVVAPGDRVLDVGCGSGVLAIAALLAGAATAIGVDTDPAALDATRANARRNAVADRLTTAATLPAPPEPPPDAPPDAPPDPDRDVAPAPGAGFELVVANMLAPTLVEVAPALQALAGAGGRVVVSGLLTTQRRLVLAAYPFRSPVAAYDEDGWLALVLAPS